MPCSMRRLDAEADRPCGAGRYERSQARQDTRAGSYERSLQTQAGEVSLKVPKLRRQNMPHDGQAGADYQLPATRAPTLTLAAHFITRVAHIRAMLMY
jgi:transposase-like protein